VKPIGVLSRLTSNSSGILLLLTVVPWIAFGHANYAVPYSFTTILGGYGSESLAADNADNLYFPKNEAIWKVICKEWPALGRDV
jgi:hypothetical protein